MPLLPTSMSPPSHSIAVLEIFPGSITPFAAAFTERPQICAGRTRTTSDERKTNSLSYPRLSVFAAARNPARTQGADGRDRVSQGRYYPAAPPMAAGPDRKSTRLNSSHVAISYAVFCLKKKNNEN